MPKPSQTPRAAPSDVLDEAIASVQKDLKRLSKKTDAENIASRTRLVRLLGPLLAEKRKQEAHERRFTEKLTPELVMAWIRSIKPEERAAWIRDVQALDSKRSGLA
jgi:hypothetical protein